ncbi:MAG TPA: fibrobacter succinogenes major paralogous domain-containing protein [Bacteroidia bacterium]|jgi:uncharacterized protein (TIGR02145 family)|nr:fibrobacter succinogenes major paralogous domain-containing protein [Bacteroidia bacterium]
MKSIFLLLILFASSFLVIRCDSSPKKNISPPDPNSVQIGSMIWMKKNLSVCTFRNGDTIPEAKNDSDWKKICAEGKPAWCYYENDPGNGDSCGRMYNWFAVTDVRGLAPAGWHVASHQEWMTLVESLDGIGRAGKKLKLPSGWDISDSTYNTSGFSAVAAGERHVDGGFSSLGRLTTWWTSSDYNYDYAWEVNLLDINDYVNMDYMSKKGGASVRCVRDDW